MYYLNVNTPSYHAPTEVTVDNGHKSYHSSNTFLLPHSKKKFLPPIYNFPYS